MTSTADATYITAVAVQYNPRKSTKMSARSSVCKSAPPSRQQFSLKRLESKVNMPSDDRVGIQKPEQLQHEKSEVLDELLLLYGVNSYKYFEFSKSTSTWISEITPRIGTAWLCNNEAFRQMYSTSALYPRRRLGSATRAPLPSLTSRSKMDKL